MAIPATGSSSLATVSIICPCRNEIAHIRAFIGSLRRQEAADFELEIIVADGSSDDGTSEVLAEWEGAEHRVTVVSNPARIVSSGLNRAIAVATGEFIVRMDIHTEYAADYVASCVCELRRTGATCVGGPWVAVGYTSKQKAIAAAFGSAFASGGAKSRRGDYSGFVDAVYLGAWRRADLIALGGFDETLIRNQDDELSLRIVRSGGSIWQSSKIRSRYLPRNTLLGLWRQFYQYGYWRAAVLKKHRRPASVRQLVPPLFVAATAALVIAASISSIALRLLVILLASYCAVAFWAALRLGETRRSIPLIALAFASMHLSYGMGFLAGAARFGLTSTRDVEPTTSS